MFYNFYFFALPGMMNVFPFPPISSKGFDVISKQRKTII